MESAFLTKLNTTQEHDKDYEWTLENHLVYTSALVGPIVVPRGFVFDKNSVPWYMRWLFPVSGRRSDYAATLHDWLYTTELFDKVVCDEIYLEAMLHSKVSDFRAYAKYHAVDKFGGAVWNLHTRETIDAARSLVKMKEMKRVFRRHALPNDSHKAWNLSRYPIRLGLG